MIWLSFLQLCRCQACSLQECRESANIYLETRSYPGNPAYGAYDLLVKLVRLSQVEAQNSYSI